MNIDKLSPQYLSSFYRLGFPPVILSLTGCHILDRGQVGRVINRDFGMRGWVWGTRVQWDPHGSRQNLEVWQISKKFEYNSNSIIQSCQIKKNSIKYNYINPNLSKQPMSKQKLFLSLTLLLQKISVKKVAVFDFP